MKIFCVGRNYSEHAKELNNEIPEAPVIFMKPPTAILKGKDFYIPEFSSDLHYECELVYRVCKNGKHIEPQFAGKYIDAVTVGIDFTARDVQANQKKKGFPGKLPKHSTIPQWLGSLNLFQNCLIISPLSLICIKMQRMFKLAIQQ
jgi:acylpyruvate hydrolase